MTTPPTDPAKLRAARDQLKRERQQIVDAAVEAGTAIKVPVSTTQHGGNIEEAKERVLTELRKQGEKREIFFDEFVIDTGVPRSSAYFSRAQMKADEAPKERVRAPEGEALRAPDALRSQYQPPVYDIPSTERRRIQTQTEQPTQANPGGSIMEGWFMVRDGVLHVEDMHGRLLARQALQPGENAEAIAKRILRDKSGGGNDFYRPLRYPPDSIH